MLIAFENPLNESALAFPILECFHILGFAMAVGTIALVDFRLLGFGLRQNAGELAKALAPWTLFGLITGSAVRSACCSPPTRTCIT